MEDGGGVGVLWSCGLGACLREMKVFQLSYKTSMFSSNYEIYVAADNAEEAVTSASFFLRKENPEAHFELSWLVALGKVIVATK